MQDLNDHQVKENVLAEDPDKKNREDLGKQTDLVRDILGVLDDHECRLSFVVKTVQENSERVDKDEWKRAEQVDIVAEGQVDIHRNSCC